MKNIQIFSSLGIGDVVTLGPLIKKLKSIYPESRITIISVRKGYSQNIKKLFYIDEIIVLDKVSNIFKILIRKSNLLIMLGYHLSLSGFLKVFLYHILFFLLRSDKKIKYNELAITEFEDLNMVEIKTNILKKLNIEIKENDYELFVPFSFEEEKKKIEDILKEKGIKNNKLVVIHPGKKKGYPNYRWLTERWVEVANYLKKQDMQIAFIGGEDGKEQIEEIVNYLNFASLDFSTELSIEETTALISYCNLFISTNSGPMWLAAALRKPQIALCGPSFTTWDPYNKNAIVVRKVINRKHCNPSCNAQGCRYKDNLCMGAIKFEDIKKAIEIIMQKI